MLNCKFYLKNLDNGGGRIKSRAISKLLTRYDVTVMVAVVVNRHVTTTAAVDFYVGRTADRASGGLAYTKPDRPTDRHTHKQCTQHHHLHYQQIITREKKRRHGLGRNRITLSTNMVTASSSWVAPKFI